MAAGRYPFASDNTSGAAPEALDALVEFNGGSASGYGTDHVTQQAADAALHQQARGGGADFALVVEDRAGGSDSGAAKKLSGGRSGTSGSRCKRTRSASSRASHG